MKTHREEIRAHQLTIPMTEGEHNIVLTASKREGMTKAAYCRKVFEAASKISLAKLIIMIDGEVNK